MKAQGQSGRGMALSLTDEGAGSGEWEAGALAAARGQPARDPLSIRGAWQPSYVTPAPTPACLNKLGPAVAWKQAPALTPK